MKTLQQAIDQMDNKGGAGDSLRKHLNAANIRRWEDITRDALFDFRDTLCNTLAASTAKTVAARLKALLNRHKHLLELPDDWEKILAVKGDVSRSTFLTPDELKALEGVQTKTPKEKIVLVEFLIEAYTGARISDVMTLSEANFSGGLLTYTSQKSKVTATVPVSQKTKEWIAYAQAHRADEPSMAGREIIIKRLARTAGINATVKTRRGGVERETPKWMVLTSHCARKSTATNLAMAGATLTDIRFTLGHTSETMSSRYIVGYTPQWSNEAAGYFNN